MTRLPVSTRALRGGVMGVSAQLARVPVQLAVFLYLSRAVSPREHGLVAIAMPIVTGLTLLADLGLPQVTSRTPGLQAARLRGFAAIACAAALLMALAGVASAESVAELIGDPAVERPFALLALAIPFHVLSSLLLADLARSMRFRRHAMLSLGPYAFAAIVAVVLARRGQGVAALVALATVPAMVTTAFLLPRLLRTREHSSGVCRPTTTDLMLGRQFVASTITNHVSRTADDVVVGTTSGAASAGQYARGYQLLLLPLSVVAAPLTTVAVPSLAGALRDPHLYRRTFADILSAALVLTMPGAAFAAATAPWLVPLVLGPGWTVAADVFQWLALAALVQPIGAAAGWLLVSQGRGAELVRWNLVAAGLALGAFLAGARAGPVGVAATYTIVEISLRVPLATWVSGRSGPVSQTSVWRTATNGVPLSIAIASPVAVLRAVSPEAGDVEVAVAAVLGVSIAAATARWHRPTRRVLGDLISILRSPMSHR